MPSTESSVSKSDAGSAPVEFVLVSVLLIALTVAVLQLALALHVRNTLVDAASEGARWASLSGSTLASGVARTQDLITAAVGESYSRSVTATKVHKAGRVIVEIRAQATLPLFGLLGIARGIEVIGHAPIE